MLCVKICLLKSNWQRHGVCHSLLSALPRILIKSLKKVTGSATNLSLMKIFLFLKIFLVWAGTSLKWAGNEQHLRPKKKRAGKVWAGKTWAGSSAYPTHKGHLTFSLKLSADRLCQKKQVRVEFLPPLWSRHDFSNSDSIGHQ